MNLVQTIQKQTMSSLEIANLTGKRHTHVIRDIREMCESIKDDPDLVHELNIHAPHFWGTYKTKQGNEYGCFRRSN